MNVHTSADVRAGWTDRHHEEFGDNSLTANIFIVLFGSQGNDSGGVRCK